MRKFLIATDGSRAAQEAIRAGLELAAEQDAEVTILHVAPTDELWPTAAYAEYRAEDLPPPGEDESLRDAKAIAEEHEIDVSFELTFGDPVAEICRIADDLDADLVIVGSRGLSIFGQALLGSVSKGVLANTRRPVLVVRERQRVAVPAR